MKPQARRVGFLRAEEREQLNSLTVTDLEIIQNDGPAKEDAPQQVTPAHLKLRERIVLLKELMQSSMFARLRKSIRLAKIEEFETAIALDIQLNSSYS